MAHLTSQDVGSILDNFADVVEGGTAYRGAGTAYTGVPGTRSNDSGLRTGGDDSFVATGVPTATVIPLATGDWVESRWVKDNSPGFFLVDDLREEARRIVAWDNTAKEFTVGEAFSAAPDPGDTFTVRQGFKRLPNNVDIFDPEDDGPGISEGFDRRFDIDLVPLERAEFYGNGLETWSGELRVSVRMERHSRLHDYRKSATENAVIIASALQRMAHYSGTLVRALLPMEAPPEVEATPAAAVQTVVLPIWYRFARAF
jgi:hypothetical protein